MNLDHTLRVYQFEQHMSGDRLARLIFYGQINHCAIGVNLDTRGRLIDTNPGLGKTRANEDKADSNSPNETAG
jgi:hypothetical protein